MPATHLHSGNHLIEDLDLPYTLVPHKLVTQKLHLFYLYPFMNISSYCHSPDLRSTGWVGWIAGSPGFHPPPWCPPSLPCNNNHHSCTCALSLSLVLEMFRSKNRRDFNLLIGWPLSNKSKKGPLPVLSLSVEPLPVLSLWSSSLTHLRKRTIKCMFFAEMFSGII